MACDTAEPIKENESASEEVSIDKENNKEKKMSSSLVLRKAPEFKMDAYDSKTGHYVEVSSEDYKGKWSVVCFYPADFTFVCPTEIAAMNAMYDEFQELEVDILAVSTDTKFSHKIFVETEPILKGLQLTIGADPTGTVSRAFGVMIEEEGIALRGRFLINPEGVVVPKKDKHLW